MTQKIEKLVHCSGSDFEFYVPEVGKGKNPTLYFLDDREWYFDPEGDENSGEMHIEVGKPASIIQECLLQIDKKSFQKIAKEIL
jgi:hypothetical protein